MFTISASLLAILLTFGCLVILARADAKRHRREGEAILINPLVKTSLVVLALIPGFFLTIMSLYTALLVWLGAISILGWIVAQVPPKYL